MMTPLRRLRSSLCPCFFIASIFFLLPLPHALAERPWVTAPHQGKMLKEQKIEGQIQPLLTALPDGHLFTLDLNGIPQEINLSNGALSPLLKSPPCEVLASTQDGLWAVTKKTPKMLLHIAPNGTIIEEITLDKVLLPTSHITNITGDAHYLYLSDEGAPALIMVNRHDKKSTRLIEASPSLNAHSPLYRHGEMMRTKEGQPRSGGNVRFMVLSQDGQWLFYQAPAGPLYRLGTSVLTDPAMSPAQQIEAMAKWRETPSLGGLVIAQDDTLYMVDIAHSDLLQFGSDRLPWRLAHQEKLSLAEDSALIEEDDSFLTYAVLIKEPSSEGNTPSLLIFKIPHHPS